MRDENGNTMAEREAEERTRDKSGDPSVEQGAEEGARVAETPWQGAKTRQG